MDLGLKGRAALISGGSQGVGLAIARALAEEGCNIAIGARDQVRLDTAGKALGVHGTRVVAIATDFSTDQGCKDFVGAAAEALGGIDILVNNVGGMAPGTLESLSPEQWRQLLDTNLLSYVHTTRHAVPHLKKSTAGRILNISGLSGKMVVPGALSTTLANAGINGFTKQMANELGGYAITVNNLCPGLVLTEGWHERARKMARLQGKTADQVLAGFATQSMLGRSVQPAEIGHAAAFLVSDRAAAITGATLEVDAGLSRYF